MDVSENCSCLLPTAPIKGYTDNVINGILLSIPARSLGLKPNVCCFDRCVSGFLSAIVIFITRQTALKSPSREWRVTYTAQVRTAMGTGVGKRYTPSIAFRHLPPKEGCRKPVLGVWGNGCTCYLLVPRGQGVSWGTSTTKVSLLRHTSSVNTSVTRLLSLSATVMFVWSASKELFKTFR